jgi:hypothetical protein
MVEIEKQTATGWFHTYSTFGRGAEQMGGSYYFLGL